MKSRFGKISNPRKCAFLEAYAKIGTVTGAARAARVTSRSHQRWLQEDADYAEAFSAAKNAAFDAIVEATRKRAINGVWEYVLYKGALVIGPNGKPLRIRKFSDVMAAYHMNMHRGIDSRHSASHQQDDRAPQQIMTPAEAAILMNESVLGVDLREKAKSKGDDVGSGEAK